MQRRDALQPVLLEVAHRLGLPGSAGTAASNPRFDDTEVPVAVVGIHAPGVEPGCGGRQQDLTGELIDRVVDASPVQSRRQTRPVPRGAGPARPPRTASAPTGQGRVSTIARTSP